MHCTFFITKFQQLLKSLYERHLSLQNLNEKSVIEIVLYGFDTFLIQLIISNLQNALKDHYLSSAFLEQHLNITVLVISFFIIVIV